LPLLHAIVLGIVQGLTEFLPISSSGHLIVVPWLFGWNDLEDPSIKKAFDVALHIGTLVAVLAYFWSDLLGYVRKGIRALWDAEARATFEGRMAWLLVLSAVPAAIVGALFEDFIDEQLGRIPLIALSLILFGLLLWWADTLPQRRHVADFRAKQSLLTGAAQVLALNPGTSRSGITITANRMQGFDRDAAARISFLMSLPVTLGAIVFKVGKLVVEGIPDGLLAAMIAGVITSAVAGWVAVWGTLHLVRTHSFAPFVVYRIALGVGLLLVWGLGWR
jgi:undecaprenyl-diphosphatase